MPLFHRIKQPATCQSQFFAVNIHSHALLSLLSKLKQNLHITKKNFSRLKLEKCVPRFLCQMSLIKNSSLSGKDES